MARPAKSYQSTIHGQTHALDAHGFTQLDPVHQALFTANIHGGAPGLKAFKKSVYKTGNQGQSGSNLLPGIDAAGNPIAPSTPSTPGTPAPSSGRPMGGNPNPVFTKNSSGIVAPNFPKPDPLAPDVTTLWGKGGRVAKIPDGTHTIVYSHGPEFTKGLNRIIDIAKSDPSAEQRVIVHHRGYTERNRQMVNVSTAHVDDLWDSVNGLGSAVGTNIAVMYHHKLPDGTSQMHVVKGYQSSQGSRTVTPGVENHGWKDMPSDPTVKTNQPEHLEGIEPTWSILGDASPSEGSGAYPMPTHNYPDARRPVGDVGIKPENVWGSTQTTQVRLQNLTDAYGKKVADRWDAATSHIHPAIREMLGDAISPQADWSPGQSYDTQSDRDQILRNIDTVVDYMSPGGDKTSKKPFTKAETADPSVGLQGAISIKKAVDEFNSRSSDVAKAAGAVQRAKIADADAKDMLFGGTRVSRGPTRTMTDTLNEKGEVVSTPGTVSGNQLQADAGGAATATFEDDIDPSERAEQDFVHEPEDVEDTPTIDDVLDPEDLEEGAVKSGGDTSDEAPDYLREDDDAEEDAAFQLRRGAVERERAIKQADSPDSARAIAGSGQTGRLRQVPFTGPQAFPGAEKFIAAHLLHGITSTALGNDPRHMLKALRMAGHDVVPNKSQMQAVQEQIAQANPDAPIDPDHVRSEAVRQQIMAHPMIQDILNPQTGGMKGFALKHGLVTPQQANSFLTGGTPADHAKFLQQAARQHIDSRPWSEAMDRAIGFDPRAPEHFDIPEGAGQATTTESMGERADKEFGRQAQGTVVDLAQQLTGHQEPANPWSGPRGRTFVAEGAPTREHRYSTAGHETPPLFMIGPMSVAGSLDIPESKTIEAGQVIPSDDADIAKRIAKREEEHVEPRDSSGDVSSYRTPAATFEYQQGEDADTPGVEGEDLGKTTDPRFQVSSSGAPNAFVPAETVVTEAANRETYEKKRMELEGKYNALSPQERETATPPPRQLGSVEAMLAAKAKAEAAQAGGTETPATETPATEQSQGVQHALDAVHEQNGTTAAVDLPVDRNKVLGHYTMRARRQQGLGQQVHNEFRQRIIRGAEAEQEDIGAELGIRPAQLTNEMKAREVRNFVDLFGGPRTPTMSDVDRYTDQQQMMRALHRTYGDGKNMYRLAMRHNERQQLRDVDSSEWTADTAMRAMGVTHDINAAASQVALNDNEKAKLYREMLSHPNGRAHAVDLIRASGGELHSKPLDPGMQTLQARLVSEASQAAAQEDEQRSIDRIDRMLEARKMTQSPIGIPGTDVASLGLSRRPTPEETQAGNITQAIRHIARNTIPEYRQTMGRDLQRSLELTPEERGAIGDTPMNMSQFKSMFTKGVPGVFHPATPEHQEQMGGSMTEPQLRNMLTELQVKKGGPK